MIKAYKMNKYKKEKLKIPCKPVFMTVQFDIKMDVFKV